MLKKLFSRKKEPTKKPVSKKPVKKPAPAKKEAVKTIEKPMLDIVEDRVLTAEGWLRKRAKGN